MRTKKLLAALLLVGCGPSTPTGPDIWTVEHEFQSCFDGPDCIEVPWGAADPAYYGTYLPASLASTGIFNFLERHKLFREVLQHDPGCFESTRALGYEVDGFFFEDEDCGFHED